MSVSAAQPDVAEEIAKLAIDEVMLRAQGVAEALMGPDGETYGQVPARGGEFIAFYNDLIERVDIVEQPQINPADPEGEPIIVQIPRTIRVMDHLEVISPKFAQRLHRQYEREIGKMLDDAG